MWRLRNRWFSLSGSARHGLYPASNAYSSESESLARHRERGETPDAQETRFAASKASSSQEFRRGNAHPAKTYRKATIRGACLTNENKFLNLSFDGIDSLVYPVAWLRDNCQCVKCFDPVSHSRISDQLSLAKRHLLPASVSATENGVRVTWSDGHVSHFSREWLCDRSFSEAHRAERSRDRYFERVTWTAEDFERSERFRKFAFDDILHEDASLLEWLKQLATLGVAVIAGTPNENGQLARIADRIAFIRKTHYGEEFEVKGSADADNVAYKKGALQLHTDLPYYNHIPGIVMLQCIQPSLRGGDNILSDGFNVAARLPRSVYRTLSRTVVEWIDVGACEGKRFYSLNREPVLCLNYSGDLEKINWSQPQRDSVFDVPAIRAAEWYESAAEFARLIHDESNAVALKTKPGDILTFDNRRILHGRTDYEDANRFLRGAYVDWDEIYSRIRILRDELRSIDS